MFFFRLAFWDGSTVNFYRSSGELGMVTVKYFFFVVASKHLYIFVTIEQNNVAILAKLRGYSIMSGEDA